VIPKLSERNKLLCPICGFEAVSERGLKKHITMTHVRKKLTMFPFDCPICGKRFRTDNGRRIHTMRVHGVRYASLIPKELEEPEDEENAWLKRRNDENLVWFFRDELAEIKRTGKTSLGTIHRLKLIKDGLIAVVGAPASSKWVITEKAERLLETINAMEVRG